MELEFEGIIFFVFARSSLIENPSYSITSCSSHRDRIPLRVITLEANHSHTKTINIPNRANATTSSIMVKPRALCLNAFIIMLIDFMEYTPLILSYIRKIKFHHLIKNNLIIPHSNDFGSNLIYRGNSGRCIYSGPLSSSLIRYQVQK
jgi:hypothetical protein